MVRNRRNPRPLDGPRLRELALAYVARFATSRGKLSAYLTRKLREQGWDGEQDPDVEFLVNQMVDAGYVDDAAYAASRSGSLLRRGYGARRVRQDLGAAGIDEALCEQMRPDGAAQRQAALTLARKRRFGPFGDTAPDRPRREKQIAAMLRAGHAIACKLVDAASAEEAETWAGDTSEVL